MFPTHGQSHVRTEVCMCSSTVYNENVIEIQGFDTLTMSRTMDCMMIRDVGDTFSACMHSALNAIDCFQGVKEELPHLADTYYANL